jgi:hydrogenase maturation protease
MKTLVLGLGNPILTDDGVGVLVAEEVRKKLPEDTPIEINEVSIGGLSLMESMIGYDRVILIDAFQNANGHPGTVHKMNLQDLIDISPTQHSASPHDASLVTALEAGQRLGFHLPKEITIYAIEVDNVEEFGDQPTPLVAEVIPRVTESVLREIHFEKSNALAS